jgi:hypothetical protein
MATDTRIREKSDLLASLPGFVVHWGLPIAAMVLTIGVPHPVKTWVWIAALAWTGIACLINARRCGRTHCYYTGPFFLIMTLPVLLHGYEIVPLGTEGWKWLAIAIGVGGGGLWCVTEKLLGRYRESAR